MKLYPSPPLENNNLERSLERKLNDVNSFNNSISNTEEMITFFIDRNRESEKNIENYKTLTTVLESFDTFVIVVTTSSSPTLSLTGLGLIVIPTKNWYSIWIKN